MRGEKERELGVWVLMVAGLAEAAGLISRSDGAMDDLVELEPAQEPWCLPPVPDPTLLLGLSLPWEPAPTHPHSAPPGASPRLSLGDS